VPKSEFYGWKLLGAFWVILFINLAFPAYGSSVINVYMTAALHLDRKMHGLPYSVYMIMSGLPGPLVAMCVNRKGVRFTLIVGSLMIITGALIMALFVNSGVQAALAFGLIVGAGVATGGALASQTGVTYWFVRRRALALSLILSAGGIGGFVAAPLLDFVIRHFDGNWRMGWWVVAGLSTIACIVAAVFVKEQPADVGQVPDGGTTAAESTDGKPAKARVHVTTEQWTYGEVVRSPALWLMLVSALGVSAGFTLFFAHGLVHLKDLGHSMPAAAATVSTVTISSLLAKIVVAIFGDRMDPRYIWAGFTAVFGVGMLLIVNASGPMDLYPFAICLGSGFGGMLVCMMAVLGNYYGSKAYASVVGLALAIQTSISALASFAAGPFYDVYHTYAPAFYVIAAVCFAGAVLLLVVRPPVRRAPVRAAPDASRSSSAGVIP
jgi:MFS family permease